MVFQAPESGSIAAFAGLEFGLCACEGKTKINESPLNAGGRDETGPHLQGHSWSPKR